MTPWITEQKKLLRSQLDQLQKQMNALQKELGRSKGGIEYDATLMRGIAETQLDMDSIKVQLQ